MLMWDPVQEWTSNLLFMNAAGSLEASSNQVYIMSRTMGPEVGHRFFLTWRGQGQIAMTTTAPPKKGTVSSES